MENFRYFGWAILFTLVGLIGAAGIGWLEQRDTAAVFEYTFICLVLAVLEISLSFDNAIVNARILHDMSEKWQRRFLTWGIIIAVFGMRIVFPLLIVALAAWIDPIAAVKLAIWQPHIYANVMEEAHTAIAAFGGIFLLMVGIKFFLDGGKTVHWISFLERPAKSLSSIAGAEIIVALAVILSFDHLIDDHNKHTFLVAAIFGLITYLLVEALGSVLDATKTSLDTIHKNGVSAFIYLEVLDASFSFDGVVGAFALSQNLFIIAIGLGIGAFYVRSMTIFLVDKGTLNEYRYLEHGAFYAILFLALVMLLQTLIHIPEFITGAVGMCLIVAAFLSSVHDNRSARRINH